ncbi:MAG: amidohydrolase family protein [Rhodobacteraceae bacterium]|nr:amidohydrolase family protein [Paracoccaceae bacterium]
MRFLKWLALAVLSLTVIGVVAFLTFGPGIVESGRNAVVEHAPYPVSDEAAKLHATLTIGDWHADSLLWKRNLLKRGTRGQVDIPRLQEGNVAIQMFTAVTKSPAGQNYDANSADATDNITLLAMGQLWPVRTWDSLFERALYQADKLHRFQAKAPNDLKIIRSRADLQALLDRRAKGENIVGGLLGIEGSHPLEGRLENLDVLVDAGYRMIALQHFFDNALGGSLHGEGNLGLTDFGRQVVREVAARKLVLDVAHSSPQVARDVLEITDIPFIVSHTGIHSHCKAKRNYPDDLMRAIARSGGVIAIGYWADVTCDDSPAGVAATIKAAIDLVGEDHVSLGSDFDGSVTTGFDTSELPALTHELLAAGLSEAQIRKVMGENMLRVLRDRLE